MKESSLIYLFVELKEECQGHTKQAEDLLIFDIVAQHTQHGKNGLLKFFLCRKLFSISHRLLACLDVFAPTIGKPLAVVNTMLSSKAILRKLQVLRRDDEAVIHTGLDMLNAKVVNQAAIFKYFFKYRKRRESSFMQIQKDIDSMEDLAQRITEITQH